MPDVNIILGPPGTGKTENLLRIVDRELKEKTASPEHIGFFSFTRKATNEARDRAKAKFNLTDKDLPHFRTLHSFGKRQLGMTNTEVMGANDYRDFSNKYGVELKFVTQDWEDNGIVSTDNRYIREINKARMKCEEIQEFYNKENLPFAWQEFLWAYRSLEEYKHKNSKYDYTDMLSLFVETGPVPRLDVVIVDEAQDLTKLQWKMCEKIWKNAKRVYISGDDDQAIFRWAGADIEYLINMQGNVRVLDQSYRCPQSVHKVAAEIVQRIKYRRPKEWKPRKEMGSVRFHAYPEAVDVRSGKWLILATCGYMLDEMEKDLRIQGLPYKINNKVAVKKELLRAVEAWNRLNLGEEVSVEDIGYIYSNLTSKIGVERGYKNMKSFPENPEKRYEMEELVMNHGLLMSNRPWDIVFDKIGNRDKEYIKALEKFDGLTSNPNINLSTIHMAKGGECDNVMLLTDLSRANRDEMEKNSDDTNRVFYVGATRAKQSLHIINPQQERGFII